MSRDPKFVKDPNSEFCDPWLYFKLLVTLLIFIDPTLYSIPLVFFFSINTLVPRGF